MLKGDSDWVVQLLNIECLVGCSGRFVAAFRAGNALYQLECFETLHLVAYCPWVPVNLFGDVFALDGALGLLVEVR